MILHEVCRACSAGLGSGEDASRLNATVPTAGQGLSNMQSYAGKPVTVTGTIGQVVSPNAYTVAIQGNNSGGILGGPPSPPAAGGGLSRLGGVRAG
jgi:hypothetical protein